MEKELDRAIGGVFAELDESGDGSLNKEELSKGIVMLYTKLGKPWLVKYEEQIHTMVQEVASLKQLAPRRG